MIFFSSLACGASRGARSCAVFGGEGDCGIVGVEERESGLEAAVDVEESESEVEGVSGDVGRGNGIVGAFVEVVIVGDVDFGSFELFVEESHLQRSGEFAFENFEFVADLCIDCEVAEESHRFLLNYYSGSEFLSEQFEWCVGGGYECARCSVDADPLHSRSSAQANVIGVACCRGVVVGRNHPVVGEHSVALGHCSVARRYEDRQECDSPDNEW